LIACNRNSTAVDFAEAFRNELFINVSKEDLDGRVDGNG